MTKSAGNWRFTEEILNGILNFLCSVMILHAPQKVTFFIWLYYLCHVFFKTRLPPANSYFLFENRLKPLAKTTWKVSKYGVSSVPYFSRIRTEYGEIRSISPYSVQMRENTDQEKLRIWKPFTLWGLLLFKFFFYTVWVNKKNLSHYMFFL